MFQLSRLVSTDPGTVGAGDSKIRHEHVANGNARAAAAAHTNSVPIVKDPNVGYWKDRERKILKTAGLIEYWKPEHVPIGMVDA